jgi:hypothetical protein
MKIEDIVFRSINAVGFAANAVSLCMPYGSHNRQVAKYVSMSCNFVSEIALFRLGTLKKDGLPALASCIAAFADERVAKNAIHPDTQHMTERYLDEAGSMGIQLINMIRGFEMKNNNDKDDGKLIALPDIKEVFSSKPQPA